MELFAGQLDIDDILQKDLPLINEMIVAKQKQLAEKEKLRKEMEAKATRDSSGRK